MIFSFVNTIHVGSGADPSVIHTPDNVLRVIYTENGLVKQVTATPELGLYNDLSFSAPATVSPDSGVYFPSLKKVAHYGAYGYWAVSDDHRFVIYMFPEDVSDTIIDGQTQFGSGGEAASLSLTLINRYGKLISRYRSIITPGTRLDLTFTLGNAQPISLGVFYVDRAAITYPDEKVSVTARSAIGKLLKEQTFDETNSWNEGTFHDNIAAILDYAGVENCFVGYTSEHPDALEFDSDTTILEGLKYALSLLGASWKVDETPEGVIGVAESSDVRFPVPSVYTFTRDRNCWSYSIEYDDSDGASRVCVWCNGTEERPAQKVFLDVEHNGFMSEPGHRTLYVQVYDGASGAYCRAAASTLAASLAASGRKETFAGIFTPQLTLGDEVRVIDENGARETVGTITDVTHSFGRSGFSTSFATDSGGRRNRAKLKDLISAISGEGGSFTGVKSSYTPAPTYSLALVNSLPVEVTSDTGITSQFISGAANLLMAFVVHRSDLTETPSGWTRLHTTAGIVYGEYTQRLSIFYRFISAPETTEVTFTQTEAGRMYVNFMSFKDAGTPYIALTEQRQTSATVNMYRPANDKAVWGVHRYLWGVSAPYGSWTVTNTEDGDLVQLDSGVTQPRLLTAFDKAAARRTLVAGSSDARSNETEWLCVGIPVMTD